MQGLLLRLPTSQRRDSSPKRRQHAQLAYLAVVVENFEMRIASGLADRLVNVLEQVRAGRTVRAGETTRRGCIH